MRHRIRTRRDRRAVDRASAIAAALAAAGLLSACVAGPGGAPDASPAGQVSYACALAEQVGDGYAAPSGWESAVGEEADPGAIATLAAASLLRVPGDDVAAGHPELADAAASVFQAIALADFERLGAGLADMQSACDGVDASGVATPEGQVAYACALAEGVRDEHGPADSWGSAMDDPAWQRAMAVSALVGALNGAVLPGSEGVADAASDIALGTTRADAEQVDQGLEAFVEGCAA